ncbi:DNA-binding SARP family transcriptional activator [Mycolicibacterium sp. 624]
MGAHEGAIVATRSKHATATVMAMQVCVLGGFEVRRERELVALPLNAQRLVGFLVVRERPQLRLTVAASLWQDTTQARAAANLRTALWKIRQECGNLVRADRNYLSLDETTTVDLAQLLAQARRLIDPDEVLTPADVSTRGLIGDLLPDFDEEWIRFEQERLRQLRIHALESLCRRLSAWGRHAEAIDAGQAAVAAEPLRESAQHALIAAHLAEGNVCEAKRQFGLYRDLLWESLRLIPSIALNELVTRTRDAQSNDALTHR